MAPRSTALPSAQTESARELRRAFYCEMCGKGYARINEFEAHENSYDHQHRKRLKEMKALTQNPTAAVRNNRDQKKRREKEEMLSMNLQTSGDSGARPSNAVGFRDATQVKSSGAPLASDQAKGFPAEQGRSAVSKVPEEQPKVMRPPMWEELDSFYTLVDASALPAAMQDRETPLPWARIWTDQDEMEKLCRAVNSEIDGLEGGAARKELNRVWDELSEGSDLDELDSDLEA